MFENKNEKLESIIGRNTRVEGSVTTKGTVRIDGQMTGNLDADWLILGEKASLSGDVRVTGIVVAGTVDGNITAKEIVEVKRTGQIRGDVITSKLVVIEGGMVDGKVAMQLKDGGKVVELNQEMRTETMS